MTMTAHAMQRASRITAAGVPTEAVSSLMDRAEGFARANPYNSVAAFLRRLPRPYGTRGDASNGDEVWAICRQGEVVTLMLRRHEQSTTPGQMSVDRVVG